MATEAFLHGFPANLEVQQAQQNLTAMIATGFALGRVLMPAGRQGLRMAWHALDRAIGIWTKVENEAEVDLPESIASAMQQITPNRQVKVSHDENMAIYSQYPRISRARTVA